MAATNATGYPSTSEVPQAHGDVSKQPRLHQDVEAGLEVGSIDEIEKVYK